MDPAEEFATLHHQIRALQDREAYLYARLSKADPGEGSFAAGPQIGQSNDLGKGPLSLRAASVQLPPAGIAPQGALPPMIPQ